MIQKFRFFPLFFLIFSYTLFAAKLPELTPSITTEKAQEIFKSHASFKEMNAEIMKRTLQNYLNQLDPTKTYFTEIDIEPWINPSNSLIQQMLIDYHANRFPVFEQIYNAMGNAIARHRKIMETIDDKKLPKNVKSKEFKDMKWTKDENDLKTRLTRIRALQIETSAKLDEEQKARALQRIEKRLNRYEEDILTNDQKEQRILVNVLKALAESLDTHTNYLTPNEAEQFMIAVQQRLFGIGAQLRDDINGFTVVKIVEGGPAAEGKELKAKDRIIAVNEEPVVGMDIEEAVKLIRGEEHTPVKLTVIREIKEGDITREEKKEITVIRGEVVITESRYHVDYEPYGDGIIVHIRLHAFYQDQEHSSAKDITEQLEKLKKEHKVLGVILDFRYNTGGLLTQAVDVTGLFITKGIIVSIKDNTGAIQHLRVLDPKTIWNGPLFVLTNRLSASASEIVAQSLQDYGRALIIGDDFTYGKGSYQTFTLNTTKAAAVNPQGEYKVTRGRYYTVSGKTPQLIGVKSDIVVPGMLSESELGEKYAQFPLDNDSIKENFEDSLSDLPFTQRTRLRQLYKFDLQQKLDLYTPYLDILKKNSTYRIEHDKNYEAFLKELKKDKEEVENESEADKEDEFGKNDLQLTETFNIMKDFLYLQEKPKQVSP